MDIKDIHSVNSIYWGYSGWVFLNSIALIYEPSQKEIYYNFFTSLKDILPCDNCKLHYSTHLHLLNDALENKNTLLEWLLNIRNKIYIEQNRKQKTLNDILNEIFYKNNSFNMYYICYFVVIILIFLIIIKIL
jgi:hypothetical protein